MTPQEEMANDAVTIAPHVHVTIFENEKIRVLKVGIKPGETAEMHWHPENINYVLSSGKLRITKLDNSSVEVELTEGQVTSSLAGSHMVENIGETEVKTVQVEFHGR